jgi:hypothetical protein
MLGYADDAILFAVVLGSTVRRAGVDAVRAHWPGSEDSFAALRVSPAYLSHNSPLQTAIRSDLKRSLAQSLRASTPPCSYRTAGRPARPTSGTRCAGWLGHHQPMNRDVPVQYFQSIIATSARL